MFSGCCPWEWKLHGFSGKPPRGPAASDNRCHEAKDEDEKDEKKIKMDERFEVTTADAESAVRGVDCGFSVCKMGKR